MPRSKASKETTEQKERVEEVRGNQFKADEILSAISLKFIAAPPAKNTVLYLDALRQMGSFVMADRCYLLLLKPGEPTISRIYEWSENPKNAIADYLEGTTLEGFPWLFPQLQHGDVVIIPHVDKLPEEARSSRQYWKNIRAKKAVVLPIILEHEIIGALFVEHLKSKKIWAESNLPVLQMLAALFVGMEARIRDEEELRISEEKFRTIFENFLNPVFIAGDDGRFTDANIAALDFMEQGMGDVANKRLTDWIPSLSGILPEILDKKEIKPRIMETEYTTHGKTKTMLITVVPFPVRGRVLYYGIGQDITERKQAEQKIADARTFAEGIIQGVPHSLLVITADGRVAFVNKTFYQSFSLPPEDVEHRLFWEIQEEKFDPPGLRDHINVLFATGKRIRRFEWGFQSPAGFEKSLEFNAQLIKRRPPFETMAVLVISDITEQKRLEMAIRESEERFHSLFEDSPLALWEEDFSKVKDYLADLKKSGVHDLQTHFAQHPDHLQKAVELIRVVDVNQATVLLHEAASKEAFIAGLHNVFTPDSYGVFCNEFLAFDSGERVFESEIRVRTRKDQERVLIIRLSLVEGSEDSWDRVIVSQMDITERKQAEETLRERKDLYKYIASFTQENPAPILEIREDGTIAFANIAAELALRRRGFPDDPALFFPRDMDGILSELRNGGSGFYYREVNVGSALFGESIYLSPENRTLRLYAQDITALRKERS